MRKVIITSFMTMDGVLQAPGDPEEDRTNGFKWGGWQAPYADEIMNNALRDIMATPFDLLLGRRTYEIFSAYWSYQDDEIGKKFNLINKYVVATTPVDLSWKNSILISKNIVAELKELKKQDGPNLMVHGSSQLIQTLLDNQLVDTLHIWIYPLTLGEGKKLFQQGTTPQQWKLTESIVTPTGAILATYIPDGEVQCGSFATTEPSTAELARRERWSRE